MKNSIFSTRLFRFSLQMNWLPFLIVAVASGLLGRLVGFLYFGNSGSVDIVDVTTVGSLLPFLPVALIPLTVRAFGFYMKRCEADFYESLPYTRTQVLFSQSAALAVLSLGMLLVSSATSIITAIEDLEGCIFLVGDSLLLILAYFIASLIAIFATVIAVSITGNSFNAVLASYLILFTPATIKEQLAAFAERSPTLEGTSVLLKNEFNLLTYMPSEVTRLSAYIYSLVLTILLCFVALLLFKRRRSEVATNFFANSLVGHILRICLTLNLGCSIVGVVFGVGEYESAAIIRACFSLVALLILYFGYELLARRSFRALKKTLIGLPILLGTCVLIVAIGLSLGSVMESRTPDAEDIAYVSYGSSDTYEEMSMSLYVESQLSGMKIYDDEAREIIAKALKENTEAYRAGNFDQVYYLSETEYFRMQVVIGTKLGPMVRNVMLSYDDFSTLSSILAEQDEFMRLWMDLPENPYAVLHYGYYQDSMLDREEAALVYEALLRDLKTVDFGTWYAANQVGSAEELSVVVRTASDAFKLRVPITEHTPEAYALMTKMLREKREEQCQLLADRIDEAASGGDELELSLSIYNEKINLFGWFCVDSSEVGVASAEFIKGCLTADGEGDTYVYVQLFEDNYPSYSFFLSDKYTIEEIKTLFETLSRK